MESNSQSRTESECDSISETDRGEEGGRETKNFKRRKSAISTKKIKDRFLCIIFCRFKHVRNSRHWNQCDD